MQRCEEKVEAFRTEFREQGAQSHGFVAAKGTREIRLEPPDVRTFRHSCRQSPSRFGPPTLGMVHHPEEAPFPACVRLQTAQSSEELFRPVALVCGC